MAAPVTNDWGSLNHVRTLVLMVATAFGIYLCYRLAEPFWPALAWALALAVLFTPFQRWMEAKLKRRSLAAVVSVLTIGLIVVVPATFVGQRLILQAEKGAEIIDTKIKSGDWQRALDAQPRVARLADWAGRQIDLEGTAQTLATWLSATAGSIVKTSVFQLIGFCLTFYLLYFFLRDRQAALQLLRSLSPLSETEMDRMLARVGDTIYATIYGTLVVSVVQGLLGGLMFWWLGLPEPLVWGLVMALLALVPVLGAFCVWIPAALYLGMDGSWGKALILAIWGLALIGNIDHLLRPVLVGQRLKLHTLFAFISVLGGLILFGPAGLILGPVTLTITMVLLEIWRSRTAAETMPRLEPDDMFRLEQDGGPVAPEPVLMRQR